MKASEIVRFLLEKNIIVEFHGDQLKLIADMNVITREISDLVRARKNEIVAYLSGALGVGDAANGGIRRYIDQHGRSVEISEDEFNSLVEVFRMLWAMKSRCDVL